MTLQIGDIVSRLDGMDSLTVLKIDDHKPIDGPIEEKCVVYLSDSSWEFSWNLLLTRSVQ